MLKRVGELEKLASVSVKEATFPAPFHEGLEYSSPARGTWNIVHTGMLIPESHQIFVCAQGCLRGVVLTAAEMGAMGRYSAIQIREENVLDGNMEELMTEGVADVLEKLPYRPKAVLLFISCQHFFLAYDQKLVFESLRQRFPDIRFMDCYMIPTLRKSGLTPDQKMRRQLFSLLEPQKIHPKKLNLLGSNLALAKDCELREYLAEYGYELCQLNDCETFEDYMKMAQAKCNLFYEPMALPAVQDMKERLGQDYLYQKFSFSFQELQENYKKLAEYLEIPAPDFRNLQHQVKEKWRETKELVGDTPVVVDYTFTFCVLSFTRMLLEQGFRVTTVYADGFFPEEQQDFDWIQSHYPQIKIISCNQPAMRAVGSAASKAEKKEKVLALGQKAAYFSGTDYFVNVVESGGFYGYQGMLTIADKMQEAFLIPGNRRKVIQKKGYGCESCVIM